MNTDIYVVLHPEVNLDWSSLKSWVQAIQTQLTQDFCPAWGLRSVKLKLATTSKAIPDTVRRVVLLNDADSPGALGYHSDDDATAPIGKVFVETIRKNGASVSVTLSHEILEMVADPFANQWAQTGSKLLAVEVCDPVENSLYWIKGVEVSNFVLPSYFDATQQADITKFDFLGHLTKPFSLELGGYVIKMVAGKVSQQFSKYYPRWRKQMKTKGHSRSARRI